MQSSAPSAPSHAGRSRAQQLIGHDVIVSRPPPGVPRLRGHVVWLLIGIAAQITLTWVMLLWAPPDASIKVAFFCAIGIAVCAGVLMVTGLGLWRCARLLSSHEPRSPDVLAWLHGYQQGRPPLFCGEVFLRLSPDHGPRVVQAIDLPFQHADSPQAEDEQPGNEPEYVALASEECDIELVRADTLARQLWCYAWLLWFVPTIVLVRATVPTITPPSARVLLLLALMPVAVCAAHFAFVNGSLFRRQVLAMPGRVQVTRWRKVTMFSRQDSVLLLHRGARRRPAASLLRADGKRCTLQFARTQQPGFLALLARWCHPAHAQKNA
jgi:hypothetical protein